MSRHHHPSDQCCQVAAGHQQWMVPICIIENLLRAINEDQAQKIEDEKNKIITQYYQDDEIVDLEIDDWLIMD